MDRAAGYDPGVLRPDYPLVTERLELRPLRLDDLDDLFAYHSRPDVARYLYWEPRDRARTLEVIRQRARCTTLAREGDRLVLGAVLRGTGTVIGEVNLAWVSAEHRQGEIGFVFHPDHHGKGLAGEAAREMLRLGFAGLGLHRIIGRCDARNAASARLMERLGMRREAHFVQSEIFKGEWGDEYVYAILAAEWRDTARRLVPPERSG
jgi:RimJ/RimL family protein N-acetyltransferase